MSRGSGKGKKVAAVVDLMKPVYEFRDGMRLVKPYLYTFSTHAKGRWMDRALLDILTSEFRAHPIQYWQAAIRRGFVTINGKRILDKSMHYVMKNGDLFTHKVHRHEPTIHGDITFVGQTDELFAVNKPATMPMHPSGSYNFNSLMRILHHEPVVENQPEKLHLIHRLDRVTSGIVIMAKNAEIATRLGEDIKVGKTQKTYLARIKGKFPSPADLRKHGLREMSSTDLATELERVRHEMYEAGHAGPNSSSARDKQNRKRKQADIASAEERSQGKPAIDDREVMPFSEVFKSEKVGFGVLPDRCLDAIIISCPLQVLNPREGIHTCHPEGKESFSAFRDLGFDEASNTSLVECQPLTGRTHQLRLHLQLIGHSIANDPCYGGELFYGDNEKQERAIRALRRMKAMNVEPLSKVPHLIQSIVEKEDVSLTEKDGEKEERSTDELYALDREEEESEEALLERVCRFCHAGCASWDRIKDEAALHCDGIYLHALSYASTQQEGADAWCFKTDFPEWAKIFETK